VQLPADAVLYVDGQRMNMAAAIRTVITPVLEPEQNYFYTIKAEAYRDGKVVAESKRVSIKAGTTAHVNFSDMSMARADEPAKPARITVRAPEKAMLYVDGIPLPMDS
jgi:uncharacterized protein (TIGR03000 family)